MSDYQQCAEPDCHRAKVPTSMLCSTHKRAAYNRKHNATSDGTKPGGGRRKLTDEQVAEARKMRSQFKTQREIALHFKVSIPTICKALAA